MWPSDCTCSFAPRSGLRRVFQQVPRTPVYATGAVFTSHSGESDRMFCPRHRKSPSWCVLALLAGSALSAPGAAQQTAPAKPASPPPDVLVLKNGDTLHGKLVSAMAGKVTFHSDPLGDLSISWDDLQELH